MHHPERRLAEKLLAEFTAVLRDRLNIDGIEAEHEPSFGTGAADLVLSIPVDGVRVKVVVEVKKNAVPRDIDPAVGALPGVTLLDMDDLRAFADAGTEARRREVSAVQGILDAELERYLDATSAREVAPMIVALRDRAEEVRQAELDRFRSRLEGLETTKPE